MSEPVRAGLSRAAAQSHAAAFLAGRGIATAMRDARLLLIETLNLRSIDLVLAGDRELEAREAARLSAALLRRAEGEPVARILGAWEFWGLPFRLSPATLVPRPDTETVVEAALALGLERTAPIRLLDLGTGSGCLLVALLSEWPCATGLGIDRAREALVTARDNADQNGVGARALWVQGDWAGSLRGPFDVIVANPPYIASRMIDGLADEVRVHDPRMALDGGSDGLDAYRVILGQAAVLLAPGGRLIVEIGYDQEEALRHLAEAARLQVVVVRRDLAGHPRAVVMAREPGRNPDSSGF
ncbi:peptide chain release factor N(5)-glutamine methyltransferase [Methylobacterium nodulans]|uniref:Release factor glutamine methyltransferase n=1 Tax=Methylobacterium nodulans (strain LMG 21967 / CNCM I-2342 / ORS 2060) TaxID=460265 RepID=B8IUB5_METNO|nr:peptide chain release factor N(5)-glutamine methyltransferase [Methylobacterium nodulans]ACL55160.1 modification methylase, HemK family [Methylobacterium nodulans ORS 2060]